MSTPTNKTPLIATIGALVAVVGALTAVLSITVPSPLVTGIGIGLAAILIVLLGIAIGLSRAERRPR